MKTHFENLAEALEEIGNLRVDLAITRIELGNERKVCGLFASKYERERLIRGKHEQTIHAQRQLCGARSKERDKAVRRADQAEAHLADVMRSFSAYRAASDRERREMETKATMHDFSPAEQRDIRADWAEMQRGQA